MSILDSSLGLEGRGAPTFKIAAKNDRGDRDAGSFSGESVKRQRKGRPCNDRETERATTRKVPDLTDRSFLFSRCLLSGSCKSLCPLLSRLFLLISSNGGDQAELGGGLGTWEGKKEERRGARNSFQRVIGRALGLID